MAKEVKYTLTVDAKTGIVNLGNFERHVGSVTKSLSHQSKAARETAASITSLVSGLKLLGGAVAAYGLSNIATTFLDAARVTENYNVRLQVLLGSVEKGNQLFKEMEGYASRTPFEFEEVMGAATQLSGVMGGSVETIKQWMPLIGDLAAASGLSIQDTTMQIVRMYSAGAASADLFRERGILAMLGFQAGVSYSAEETRVKLMEEWNKAGSQFKGATDKLAGTWDGTMSMIGDKWFKLRNDIMSAGVYDALKEELSAIDQEFESWLKNNEALIKQKVPEYIDNVKSSLSDLLSLYKTIPDGVVGAAGVGIVGSLLFGGPVGGTLAALTYTIPKLMELWGIIKDIETQNPSFPGAPFSGGEGEMWGSLQPKGSNVYRGKINRPSVLPSPHEVAAPAVATPAPTVTAQTSEELAAELEQRQAFFNSVNEATDIYNQGYIEKEALAKQARSELLQSELEQRMQFFADINEANAMSIQEQINLEQQAAGAKKSIQGDVANNTIRLFMALGTKNKEFAALGIAIATGMEMIRAYQSAISASTLAFASQLIPGDPTSLARATAAGAAALSWGLANVALIGAAGAANAVGTMSSGGSVNTVTSSTLASDSLTGDLANYGNERRGALNIYLQGDMLADDYYIEKLAEKISEAVEDREVRLISTYSNSSGSIA